MVLALPILLFIMALMINFGVAAAWKVRVLSMSRHAAFGSRWPRTGPTDPKPAYWEGEVQPGRDAGQVPEWDDPAVNHAVVRGPLPNGNFVRSELLDPSRGLLVGHAGTEQDFPLMAALGPFALENSTYLLDNKWQFQRTRLWENWIRRIPAIYQLAQEPGLREAYVSAAGAIFNAPFRPELRPLDRDDEFLYWENWAPDFHPRLRQFCSTDLELAEERVEELIDRIQGRPREQDRPRIPSVAEVMADTFLRLYHRVVRRLQGMLDVEPPPPNAGWIISQISQLGRKIDILDQFLARLRSGDGDGDGGNAGGGNGGGS